ncbi:MAG: HEPN domain-containing protein [Parcubacteria group bacterium Gr01-1014_48]|nr:MAG: HEPN domain-containing protein [Parcubacteria group bacterium Greene0416_14]TSC73936.1 MAG: HEPN domain-containing protein [Parcubacteria group bacterium Gr01-1014_48]TSD00948.1 MAG: HEPN domain-containing protein [Parcubacteria group bacterium Greene1014_15]TSD07899.1 MAG: HEPN domain-containing protein [Parcubacteria group bacterium Greene0714_4]
MLHNIGKDYPQWFHKADNDERSVRAVLKEGAPPTACFLAQQMAEKYLKGLLVYHDVEFFKVHDLLALMTALFEVEPGIVNVKDDLMVLNRYYIETRYPDDIGELLVEECQRAFEAALRIKEFVLKKTALSLLFFYLLGSIVSKIWYKIKSKATID